MVMEKPTKEPTYIDGCIFRIARKAWKCSGSGSALRFTEPADHFAHFHHDIEPGDPYIEYVGESHPYEHGSAVCLPCADVFYRAKPYCLQEYQPEGYEGYRKCHRALGHEGAHR